jgi:transposase
MLTFTLRTTRAAAECPSCATPSYHIHSCYTRTIADLPWGGSAVRLLLQVRKFFCRTMTCPQRIFTERLPQVVAPYARKTARLTEVLRLIGLALGGTAAARLAVRLGLPVSATTLLRLITATGQPAVPIPRALGIDEWAWRRSSRYGTLLCDLETHAVVDLLPDRSADSVAAWLQAHPGVEIVSRDRSGLYSDGVTRGAPTAIQVADRFHLLKNLGDALEQFFLQKRQCLKDAASALAHAQATASDPAATPLIPTTRPRVPWQQRAEDASLARHAQRIAAYDQILALRAKGVAVADIARIVGVSRRTVYRYVRFASPPQRKEPGPRKTPLDPYKAYLISRWQEGCQNAQRLWREIRTQGYAHSSAPVQRFVKLYLREVTAAGAAGAGALPRTLPARPLTARQVALLFLRRPVDLTETQQALLKHLRDGDSTIAASYMLTQAFAEMLRERQGERLEAWIEEVARSDNRELRRFASGLQEDQAAVTAGLTLEWSNGPTEGHIHRLKLLKRQMYGRAGFVLLRQRILHAA